MAYRRFNNNKYRAHKVKVGEETFDSEGEYKRWCELVIRQKAGEISDLRRQVKFELLPAIREPDTIGKRGGVHKGKIIENGVSYVADFVYTENGEQVVEDYKGFKTKEYLLKRKMCYHLLGLRIKETK